MSVLFKTEPAEYSFADLQCDGETVWDGVTNSQAVKFLRELKPGAKVIVYHTGDEHCAVGSARVLSVDASDPSLRWCVSGRASRLPGRFRWRRSKPTNFSRNRPC